MIPDKSNPKWKQLVTGALPHQFKVVPAGMLISRLLRESQKDRSTANIERCVKEAHEFFIKYESLLGNDIKAIFG
ncbi:MAG: hypothetical protein HQM12_03625 [SAR324 cluster bacterium]|nr:hypothetical protein [SAR324 cluster bacterium]MBF0352243.1 hypothetical protein [SAR324 cluster bacterium]